MAIIVATDRPNGLLKAIKDGIDAGSVDTWAYDKDGDFMHSPPQWIKKGWLRPHVESGSVRFTILAPQGIHMSRTVYGVYHGRFMEMLLTHFDTLFTSARATALPESGDIVAP